MSFLGRISAKWFGKSPPPPQPISEAEFTEAFAHILREASPGLRVNISGPLELKLVLQNGTEQTAFLENAFTEYQANPELRSDVLEKFVAALRETIGHPKGEIDRTRIVPVIKDAAYLTEVRRALEARGHDTSKLSQVHDIYNSELVVLYAEDTANNMRYLTEDDVSELGIQREDLRPLAVENLRRLLPDVKMAGDGGVFLMQAGGDYEASLLLIETVWSSGQIEVNGEIVVAIPARGILIVTGSENKPGLKTVRELAAKTSTEAAYRLTPHLFVFRRGRFEVFERR
jgi:uncharacterized protein YtpQ (UPF0354 family)